MLLHGDDLLHTQFGNNNSYCQNYELTWINWAMVKENADMLRFVQVDDSVTQKASVPYAPSFFDRKSH